VPVKVAGNKDADSCLFSRNCGSHVLQWSWTTAFPRTIPGFQCTHPHCRRHFDRRKTTPHSCATL